MKTLQEGLSKTVIFKMMVVFYLIDSQKSKINF